MSEPWWKRACVSFHPKDPPTEKPRVYKDVQGDWIAEDACDYYVCSDWYSAMEWAYGHLAMGHYKEKT